MQPTTPDQARQKKHGAMRIVGFLLLFGGFAWLSLAVFCIRPTARSVVVMHYDRLPKAPDTSYSREDVQREMRATTFDAIERYPSLMYPGITMLAGGLLLAFASGHPTPKDQMEVQ
jgi:hypothetical protein